MRTSVRICCGLALAAVLLMLIGLEVRQIAEASCTIAWLSSDDTCDVADAQGNFAFILETQWASQYEGPWTLIQDLSPATPHFNVTMLSPDLDSEEVGDDWPNSGLMASDEIPTTCTGKLSVTSSNGTCALSGWQADTFNCSGSRSVLIKNTGNCP